MMAHNICSLNCNGLRDAMKRKQLFSWLDNKKFNIIFLQETHSGQDDEISWSKEWGGPVFYAHGTNDSRGVAILFKPGVNFTVHNKYSFNGRVITLYISLSDKELILLNLYAPNKDDILFFENIIDKITEIDCSNIILGGDFNLVLDIQLDKTGGLKRTHNNSCTYLKQFMEDQNIVDIWRIQHPNTRQYTWRRRNPSLIHCRLDMFLISDSLQGCINKSEITPGFRTDHSLISIFCKFNDIERGPGYWKLNCSLLQDQDYIHLIRNTIIETNIHNLNEEMMPTLKWEMIKMEIRRKSISYSAKKKRDQVSEQFRLEKEIHAMEIKIEKTDQEHNILDQLKYMLKNIYDNKVRGSLVRSRTLAYEYGDRPSNYFFNLERGSQAKKSIYRLKRNNGITIDSKRDILSEINSYYSKLYKGKSSYVDVSDEIKNVFIPVESHIRLNDKLKNTCEGIMTKEELFDALSNTKNNKSPGIDGIPYEFYKVFWDDISDHLLDSINYSYYQGQLSINQRRGVISLLPKGNKDTLYLNNWRPITLLCTDYKLLSKAIATRLKQTLTHIIDPCQTGFVSGRYIGENINTILEIIDFADEENIPGLILSADFSKAFDNLDWDYLERVLKYFNFGESFRKWIKLFNTDISAVVNVNGWFTNYFSVRQGARQGDPIAAYLFIICTELLALGIRTDENIIGIKIGEHIYKICQFADDTVIFLDGTQQSLANTLDLLLHFFQNIWAFHKF